MFVKIGLSVVVLLSAGASASAPVDPLTVPIVGERTAEWLAPTPPEKLYGNTYLVGFGGLSNALIDTGRGLILIDGALPQAAPMIMANVKRLGFKPSDIKYILSTEPHFDHAGGIAALTRDTGATVIASPRGAQGLRSGRLADDDPQRAYAHSFPGLARVREIRDGQKLRLGNTVVTAVATPGHTMGSMSWSWQACEARRCRNIVFASSLNPVSAEGYRYSARTSAGIVAGFKRSYAAMQLIPCDVLITAHPSQSGSNSRYVEGPGACKAYAEASERALADRLAKERGR
ncbi:MAG: subclass B3 metallo-beta-lactamase [Sphingosinicella sp.]|nr:subclass B3 metallo-beta-lactamase [Sphingosinicella sp.]